MTTQVDATGEIGAVRRGWELLWPTLAALALAAATSIGMSSGVEVAPILAASAVVYLGAAALGRESAAWPLFVVTALIITVVQVLDGPVDGTWLILGSGAVLLVYGFATGKARPTFGLPLQSVALLGFGGAAALTLFASPDVGSYLVAAGLFGHAAWDVHHRRTRRVVTRSLAEFCLVLDVTLALVIVLLTALG